MDTGLYLVATPIGNLGDITLRALETLKEANVVLAEDTRHSLKLFRHYEIQTPLKSYHKFNEAARADDIVRQLKEGAVIALISDAGTPAISDPGSRLVRRCREEGLNIFPIPGASSVTAAACMAGFKSDKWMFAGFLPPKPGKRKKELSQCLGSGMNCILMVSPYKVIRLIELVVELAPERKCALYREITKSFEEFIPGSPEELLASLQGKTPRGEFLLILYADD